MNVFDESHVLDRVFVLSDSDVPLFSHAVAVPLSQVSQYTFYTAEDGTPLKFLMMGINYLTSG